MSVTRRAFEYIWERSGHPQHQLLRDAVSPKLWACRCFDVQSPSICPLFLERYEIYAFLGSGGFGSAWAARRLPGRPDGTYDHFAVKFEPWDQIWDKEVVSLPTVDVITSDPARSDIGVNHVTPLESVIHALVEDPDIDIVGLVEVYYHPKTVITVVELYGHVPDPQMDVADTLLDPLGDLERKDMDFFAKVRACSGAALVKRWFDEGRSRPANEPMVCRIFHGLFQAIHHIHDRGCTHNDLYPRNMLVDQDYRPRLIDFGQSKVYRDEAEYDLRISHHRAPEQADTDLPKHVRGPPFIWYDARRAELWDLALVIYRFLHGRDPNFYENLESLHGKATERACRTVDSDLNIPCYPGTYNNCLPVDLWEGLSQDAADIMQASLRVAPNLRPSIQELSTFPWLSGWTEDHEFESPNPLSGGYVSPAADPLPDKPRPAKVVTTRHTGNDAATDDWIEDEQAEDEQAEDEQAEDEQAEDEPVPDD